MLKMYQVASLDIFFRRKQTVVTAYKGCNLRTTQTINMFVHFLMVNETRSFVKPHYR